MCHSGDRRSAGVQRKGFRRARRLLLELGLELLWLVLHCLRSRPRRLQRVRRPSSIVDGLSRDDACRAELHLERFPPPLFPLWTMLMTARYVLIVWSVTK